MKQKLLFLLLLVSYLGTGFAFAQAGEEPATLGIRGTNRTAPVAKQMARPTSPVGDFYPNPAVDNVEITLNIGQAGKFTVYNLLGTPVMSRELAKDDKDLKLDVTSLTAGVYFCNFQVSGKTVATRRMVIRR